jgi:hypothetical protein
MSMPTSRARRNALRLLAAAAVAATLVACDTPMAPVSPDATVVPSAPAMQNDATPDSASDSTGRSGWTNPHG